MTNDSDPAVSKVGSSHFFSRRLVASRARLRGNHGIVPGVSQHPQRGRPRRFPRTRRAASARRRRRRLVAPRLARRARRRLPAMPVSSSRAFAAAQRSTPGGTPAMRATFRPNERCATPVQRVQEVDLVRRGVRVVRVVRRLRAGSNRLSRKRFSACGVSAGGARVRALRDDVARRVVRHEQSGFPQCRFPSRSTSDRCSSVACATATPSWYSRPRRAHPGPPASASRRRRARDRRALGHLLQERAAPTSPGCRRRPCACARPRTR